MGVESKSIMTGPAIVSICPGSSLPWPAVAGFLQQEGLEAASLTFVSSSASAATSSAAAGLCSCGSQNNREAFAFLAKQLAPSARLYVYDALRVGGVTRRMRNTRANVSIPCMQDAVRQAGIVQDLVLSGFTHTKIEAFSGVVLVGQLPGAPPCTPMHSAHAHHK